MKRALPVLAMTCLGSVGTAQAMAVSAGGGASPLERIYLGIMFGLAGVLPGTALAFALLTAMFCHPARSQLRQALLGAVIGSVAYLACVLIGSVTLGPLLEDDHPLRPLVSRLLAPYADYLSFDVLVITVFALPALPFAIWSVWRAHAAPAKRTT